ncbi:MAG: hypothetical protein ABMA64_05505 [Myxococcota bacterium]
MARALILPVTDDPLFAHVSDEVAAAAAELGWGYQIRRKYAARERPVWESGVVDYEWKLVPSLRGNLGSAVSDVFDEGTYYVLSVGPALGVFQLQHDTFHAGNLGIHWSQATYTQFRAVLPNDQPPLYGFPLRAHLVNLARRFGPNTFSRT